MEKKTRILIAGIGGASLGTELLKCLSAAGTYSIFGCDISSFAFGHYQEGFKATFLVDSKNYIDNILCICEKHKIQYIVPGGEQPLYLLNDSRTKLEDHNIRLVANSSRLIRRLSDKFDCYNLLKQKGIKVPITIIPEKLNDLQKIPFPCIVKPSINSGGSDSVFLSKDRDEAWMYVEYLRQNHKQPIVQEYIPLDEGEFSFGVLSLPQKGVIGSIALKKIFPSKLSIHSKTKSGIISSPYSQGLINEFRMFRNQAERIAAKIDSEGPINIQGRIKNDILIPFEINPRFSGSEFTRAMAGFNQVDIFLRFLQTGKIIKPKKYRYGYYMKSLSEIYVPEDEVIS